MRGTGRANNVNTRLGEFGIGDAACNGIAGQLATFKRDDIFWARQDQALGIWTSLLKQGRGGGGAPGFQIPVGQPPRRH